jgi:hypothetical protein
MSEGVKPGNENKLVRMRAWSEILTNLNILKYLPLLLSFFLSPLFILIDDPPPHPSRRSKVDFVSSGQIHP